MAGVVIRRLTPTDRPTVARGFEQLSAESRYLRFGRARIAARSALDWLERLDDRTNFALGACVRGSPIGVARCVRVDAETAEIAVTVIDAWQGRGVGRMLLAELVSAAHAAGIATLRAHIIAGNRPAVRLMLGIGGRRVSSDAGLVEYEAETTRPDPLTAPAGASAGPRQV